MTDNRTCAITNLLAHRRVIFRTRTEVGGSSTLAAAMSQCVAPSVLLVVSKPARQAWRGELERAGVSLDRVRTVTQWQARAEGHAYPDPHLMVVDVPNHAETSNVFKALKALADRARVVWWRDQRVATEAFLGWETHGWTRVTLEEWWPHT